MQFIKRTAILITISILLSLLPISAANYPAAFWKLNDKYVAAVNAQDDNATVEYASQICALFEGRTDETAVSILSSRYYELGNALDRLGRYEEASVAYEKSIPCFELVAKYGLADTSDNIKIASTKAMLYKSTLELYRTHYGYQTYYGAINEKRMGVLYGVNFDGGARDDITGESMVLIYQNFGEEVTALNKHQLKLAADKGLAVEFALNLPGEGAQVNSVTSSRDYIMDVIDILNDIDAPIFLRFAAEMDTWTVQCNPKDYVRAFKYFADLVHEHTDHVAVVWSPTFASGWNINVHDFYPGDEYVDWVGVSLYLMKYFMARDNWSRQERIALPCYFSGDAADPVKIMDDLIKTYGDRKPFIISESGASHTYRHLNGQYFTKDTTSWALPKLRMMYKYLPMAYPQIKAMSYFDRVMPNSACDFALSSNSAMKSAYLEFVKDDAYIQNSYNDEANATYLKLSDTFSAEQGITELRVMASFFGHDNVTVTYLIDGVQAAASATLPYTVSLDLSKYTVGNHKLTIRASEGGKLLGERSYTMSLSKAADIYIDGEYLPLSQKPVIVEGTTLVPLRAVVEKLGGKVEWIGETREIKIKSGKSTIMLRIGSYDMNVDGKISTLLVPARLINSSTYIPLRAVAEAMKCDVSWQGDTRSIIINKK